MPRPPRESTSAHRPLFRASASHALLILGLAAVVASAGCATLGGDRGQPLVPTRHETRTGPFAVFSSAPLGPESPPIRSLRALESDVGNVLGLRANAAENPVEVYILRDRETFTHFLTFYFPELPPRRAFFIAQGGRRVVYTFQNDRLEEDLRHEATHALLHLTVGDLPLWLDEGLAEYFEGTEAPRGLNLEHLERLPDDLSAGWKPDLARLEALRNVQEMTPRDYRESWAWIHFLLDDPSAGKARLIAYLSDIRRGAAGANLSRRLQGSEGASAERMLVHLDRVREAPRATRLATPREPAPRSAPATVLLQNAPLEPVPRRSLFGRFIGLFGLGGRSN